ncbi:MAG: type II toxin-antitoxin system HicB family antitoxin [Candidatus Binatus sp.]
MKAKQDKKGPANEIIFSVEESPEGGFEARALGHSIFTQADSREELRAMVQDAVRCHFEDSDRPRVIRLHWVKDELLPA